MIISDRFRFVFVHIPKCGGTSVRAALADFDEREHVYYSRGRAQHSELGFLDYHHIPLALLSDHFREDFECVRNYASFALTRDPFARFPSSLSESLMWRGRQPQKLTSAEIAREVDEVIEYLSHPTLSLPVTEPDFIHFGRQVDYTDLDGKRIIRNIYPIERLPDMLSDFENLTGAVIPNTQLNNERLSYDSKILQYTDNLMQNAITAFTPRYIWKPVFNLFKRHLVRTGLLKKWSQKHSSVFKSTAVSQFVAEFYAEDVRLYKDVRSYADQVEPR